MKCSIEVNGLELRAFHGVLPEERVTGNRFRVDVKVYYPFEQAINSDVEAHTLSYADIVEVIKEEMAVRSALLENVVGRIYSKLTGRYPLISGGEIRVAKLVPPLDALVNDCAVKIEW